MIRSINKIDACAYCRRKATWYYFEYSILGLKIRLLCENHRLEKQKEIK